MPARARVVAPRLRRVFNLQGSELVIILLLALVVLGPEKLPDAMRKLGNFYGQMKKMSTSFQQEFKSAVDEPMREVRETANMLRDSADFRKLATGDRPEKPKSAEMAATPAADSAADAASDASAPEPASAPVAADSPPDIPAPKPPAGPVVTGTPPVPASTPAPPPPPPPPAGGAAAPTTGALPPLAASEVEAE